MTPTHRANDDPAHERLEQLFRANEPADFAYIRRRTAGDAVDDLVAETFLVAWRRIDEVPAEPLPWLLAVARRVLSTQRRGERRRRSLDERLEQTEPRIRPWDEEGGDDATAALARLSERDQEALRLIAWEGLTPAQAATVLGEPAGRFRVRLPGRVGGGDALDLGASAVAGQLWEQPGDRDEAEQAEQSAGDDGELDPDRRRDRA